LKETEEKPIEELKDEEINLLEYIYDDGATVEVPGRLIEGLIQTLRQVEQSETNQGFISSYPAESKVKKDKTVDIKWELYPTAEAYFSQQPQETKSMLGVMALDLLMLLQQVHLENIKSGKAVKVGTLRKVEDEVELS
jgi:hypothetical protein